MIATLKKQWFLIALLAMLALGMALPDRLQPVADAIPRTWVVAVVLLLMSITLAANAMWRAVRRPQAALLAVVMNSALAPPLAWLLGLALPVELAVGLVIAATSPCTLASAAVWTRRAGGNDAVALLVTMITNVTCFAVVPAWLQLLVGQSAEVDFARLMLRLLGIAVVPIVVAQLLRQWRPLAGWVDRHKPSLSNLAQVGLLSIVFVGAVHSGQTLTGTDGAATVGLGAGGLLLAAVLLLHVVLFAVGLLTAGWMRMADEDQSAVAIAGSQKTLMIGLDVALGFGGLAVLPMVAYHAVQLVVDTVLADWLRGRR